MLVIIGSGLAAYNLAKEWRALDQHTALTLITQDSGDFYSKPMLSTALAQNKTAQDLVISSAAAMAEQLQATIKTQSCVLSIHRAEKTLRVQNAEGIIETLAYTHCVLATGASPIQPSWSQDLPKEYLHRINLLDDYRFFREKLAELGENKHIVIIGSGLVGCEYANDLITAGYAVTVLSAESAPLASLLPLPAAELLQKGLADKGVSWIFDDPVRSLEQVDKASKHSALHIILQSGRILQADMIISACGLKPHSSLAQEAGLAVDPRNQGIACNAFLQSSDPAIYALGDCASVEGLSLFYVPPLMQGARALAKTLSGTPTPVHYPPTPIGVKTRLCPVIVYPARTALRWEIAHQEGQNLKMLGYHPTGTLCAFVLMGSCITERQALIEQMPPLFPQPPLSA